MSETRCKIDGCTRPYHQRGYCRSHYMRWYQHGDPLAGRTNKGAAAAFLETAVGFDGDECLKWPFFVAASGYGHIQINGLPRGIHRVICERVHGAPTEQSSQAAHSCGVRTCCNPNHIRWATAAENNADKLQHGTAQRGERAGRAKLTNADVNNIRKSVEPQRVIARRHGVSQAAISSILTRKTWGHLGHE